MAKTPVFKRCGCRETVTNETGKQITRRLGTHCPNLRRHDGSWNPKHGSWYFQVEITIGGGHRERHLTRGGLATEQDAKNAVARIRELVNLAKHIDDEAETVRLRSAIVDLIQAALRGGRDLPTVHEVESALVRGTPTTGVPTVEEHLTLWLAGKAQLRSSTARAYRSHIDKYLIPHLGHLRLDKLRPVHIDAMFHKISEETDIIPSENEARRAVENALAHARQASNTTAARAARNKLATMPPYRRPVNPATRQRIRATLRSALSSACRQELISRNVAKLVELESGRAPKPQLWTPERVEKWRKTGVRPSPVMVWTPEQTSQFVSATTAQPLSALYQLIIYTGLRRGEACGLRWIDLDLANGVMTVAQSLIQLGWKTDYSAPKTLASGREVALAAAITELLRSHREQQRTQSQEFGHGWIDTGLVFTNPDGSPLHPATVTKKFGEIAAAAGLPPVRLHDLRHGTATTALAAGVDLKVVQEMLGHANLSTTADIYTSVVGQLQRGAAEAVARQISPPENHST